MKKYILFLISFTLYTAAQAQTDTSSNFSLQQAIDYAIKRQYEVEKARLDVQSTEMQFKEVRGMGMPQIDAGIDFRQYFIIPTTVVKANAFDPTAPPDAIATLKFGTTFNTTASVNASQILFSSDYIVALQATKELRALTEKNLYRTEIDVAYNVSKAYYLVLVTDERIKQVDYVLERLEKLLQDTRASYKAGFVEKIDVDRLEVNYNNFIVERENLKTGLEIVKGMLKFQMGYPMEKEIHLTDLLQEVNFENVQVDTTSSVNNRIEYKLMQSQLRVNELDLKRRKLAYAPYFGAYAGFAMQAMRYQFDLFDFSQDWYPMSYWGLQMNIPVFDGLQKHYKIQQSKISMLKTKQDMYRLESGIQLEVQTAAINYQNSLNVLKTQKANMELASNVAVVSKEKYQAGVGSNLEVITAVSDFKQAQINYYTALYNAMIAKIEFEKAKGNLYTR